MTAAAEPSATFVAPPMALDSFAPVRRDRRRVQLLALVRRPSRVAQLEQLTARYRWANTGLRERLAELDAALDTIDAVIDEQARILGHAHPVIVDVRAALTQARHP